MPGLYGPGTALETHTGLFFNDEILPIVLPDRVSIQGTSALNTVFVSDGNTGVFEFGSAANAFAGAPLPELDMRPLQFLANIAITGAIRAEGYTPALGPTTPEQGAGVFVNNERRCSLLLANCVLYNNAIGLLVDDVPQPPPGSDPITGQHSIQLINNTFAWNVCGLWNGQINRLANSAAPNPSLGLTAIALVNNLFDATPPILNLLATPRAVEIPLFGTAAANLPASWSRWVDSLNLNTLLDVGCMTPFEGVDASDLATAGGTDFNAYEGAKQNLSSALIPGQAVTLPASVITQMTFLGLHQTTERVAQPAGQVARRNLSAITGVGTQRRGILFARDLLHEGGRSAAGPFFNGGAVTFDRCVGDFRLAPATLVAGQPAETPPGDPTVGALNPLVDADFTFVNDANGNPVPLTMANGLEATPDPFRLVAEASEASFPHTPWDWDLEGYGNVRVFDHPIYPETAQGDITDIGADELDLLIMVGYRETTTTFINLPASNRVNDRVWYLCAHEGLPGAVGGTVPLTIAPAPPFHANYPAMGGWQPTPPATYYTPTGWLDTVPHLLPDIHPWWWTATLTPTRIEWRTCVANPNVTLYLNPTVGIINPVGAGIPSSPSALWNWLDDAYFALFAPPTLPFGPLQFLNEDADPSATPPFLGSNPHSLSNQNVSTMSAWCAMHDDPVGGVPRALMPSQSLSITPMSGDDLRVSCEFLKPLAPFDDVTMFPLRGSNLQSFFILH